MMLAPTAGCGSDEGEPASDPTSDAVSMQLVIDLQEGFRDHTVEVTIGGETVSVTDGVTTSALLGLADSLTIDVPGTIVEVGVIVRPDDIEYRARVDLANGEFLGLSLVGGEIEPIQSLTAFGYG